MSGEDEEEEEKEKEKEEEEEHLSTERIVQHTVLLWRSSHLIPDIIS